MTPTSGTQVVAPPGGEDSTMMNEAGEPLRSAPITAIACNNYMNNAFVPPSSGAYISVENPSTGDIIGRAALSQGVDVGLAVAGAEAAFPDWSEKYTVKARAAIMMKFHALVQEHAQELAELIVMENGKNITEALADVAKGNETVEYACSLPQLSQGKSLRVSSQVTCVDRRDPLGIVASIVPFNFPFMVPMWTLPIALVMGNCVILKPSEKVPLTMTRVMGLLQRAGLPPGVLQLVHGQVDAVNAIIQHPSVRAVTFVGSSPIAELVATQCSAVHKRVVALGGAKNHLVALPDCPLEQTASDVVVSFAGCAGQRCMAASVLLLVGDQPELLNLIVEKARALQPGTGPGQVGPVIDTASYNNIMGHLAEMDATTDVQVLLDGRQNWQGKTGQKGNWVGPTIVHHKNATDRAMREEIFGPILSVYTVASWHEAIAIENANFFGNAACVYTSNGGNAEWFCKRFRAGMLGVNVGIPVPREPFSFGGLYGTKSKFGDMDITGDAAMEFFSHRIKITSKWAISELDANPPLPQGGAVDHANFAGTM